MKKTNYKTFTANTSAEGKFRIKTLVDGEVVRQTDWIKNLVVNNNNNGLNIIAKRHIGELAHDIEITSAEIGTGTTAPTTADTNLETPITTGIPRSNQTASGGTATFEFFISSTDLPNGTYGEFGLRAGTQLYTRASITPTYTKSDNENTSIEYIISYSNQ